MKEVITTKDLREICQNGVTLDDLRKLYGVYTTLEDLELIMPSRLIDNLGILPWSKVDTEISESQEESQDKKKEEFGPGQNEIEEKVIISQNEIKDKMNASQDMNKEKVSISQDETEEEKGSSQTEKGESAVALLSSKDQQAEREIESQASSFYNPPQSTVPWHPLFALCLLPQTSNMLDILTGLQILSQMT